MTQFVFGLLIGSIITYIFSVIKNKQLEKRKELISDNEKMLTGLVENSRDGFYYFEVKPRWRYRYAYPPFEVTFGEEQGNLVYDNPQMAFERVHPDDQKELLKKVNGDIDYSKPVIYRIAMGEEAFNKGKYTLFEEYTTPVYQDGELIAIQGILRDITEKKELERQLEYRITHDNLTGLFNREYFDSLMGKYGKDESTAISILIIDLDNLKIVNDTYGHKQGDQLIKEAANLLNAYSSNTVIVSRIGGDEFAILMISADIMKVEELVQNIRQDIASYSLNNEENELQMSIGYAFNERSIGNMESLYVEADRRMYEDKVMRKKGASGK